MPSVGNNITFQQLLTAAYRHTVVFTNWHDNTNFPFIYGSGIVFPGFDSQNLYFLYAGYGVMYSGYYSSSAGSVKWTKCSN